MVSPHHHRRVIVPPGAFPKVQKQPPYAEPPAVVYTPLVVSLTGARRRLLQASLLERLRPILSLPEIETNIIRLRQNLTPQAITPTPYVDAAASAASERASYQTIYDTYGNIDVRLTRSIFHDHVAKARLALIRAANPNGTAEHAIDAVANISAALSAKRHTGCGFGAARYYATIRYNEAREHAKQEAAALQANL